MATAKTLKHSVVTVAPHQVMPESTNAANPAITEATAHQRTSPARHRARAAKGCASTRPAIPGDTKTGGPHNVASLCSATAAVVSAPATCLIAES